MVAEWDADDAIRWAYYANVYVWACARAIAQDLAALPFRAGLDPDKYEDYDIGAPLAQLLGPPPGGPAPEIPATTFWEWIVTQYLVTGRFSAEITFDDVTKRPSGLWPLPSGMIQPIPSQVAGRWFDGFWFGRSYLNPVMLPYDRVFYHWRPAQHDYRQPESVIQAARLDVSVAVMQDRYDYAFLNNDARPAAMVVHEEFKRREDRDEFRDSWNNDHQGPDNAGRVRFVEASPTGAPPSEALRVIQLGMSQKDAEFIARYERKVRSIVMAFGVPLSRLGDSSDRTFSNADQETKIYYQNRLIPLAKELATAVNIKLAPRVGRQVGWFDCSSLEDAIRDNHVIAAGPADLVKSRIITINESRAALGLRPVDGGDRFLSDMELALVSGSAAQLMNLGTIPAPMAPELPWDPAAPPEPEPEPEPVPAPVTPDVGTVALDANGQPIDPGVVNPVEEGVVGPSADAVARSVDITEREMRRAKVYKRTERHTMVLERQMAARMQKLFDQQRDAVLSRLNGKRGRQAMKGLATELRADDPPANLQDVSHLFDAGFWSEKTATEVRSTYDEVWALAAGTLLDDLDVGFDAMMGPHDAIADEFISGRANQLAGVVTEVTYRGIREQLVEGVQQGESIPKLADRIRNLFEQTYAARATTVARTEVISAYNGSATRTAEALPGDIVGGLEWLSTPGPRTRPAHSRASGQVVAKGQQFQVGLSELRYPGDPSGPPAQTVNCRCTVLVLSPEEYATSLAGQRSARLRLLRSGEVEQELCDIALGRSCCQPDHEVA